MEISTNIKIVDGFGPEKRASEGFSPEYLNPDFPIYPEDLKDFPYLADFIGKGPDETVIKKGSKEEDADQEFEKLSPKELGREGERLAASYLTARGYEILERNWRCCEGEIDIICEDEEGTIVLVEVKSRYDRGPEPQLLPELAVDNNKQRKIARLALWYLVDHPDTPSLRFDVIAINVMGRCSARIRHLVGAFTWDE